MKLRLENNNECLAQQILPEFWEQFPYLSKLDIEFYGGNCGEDDNLVYINMFNSTALNSLIDIKVYYK